MHLTILSVDGCPNAPVLERRLAAVLQGRTGVSVSREVISTEGEAARWAMHGSPTLLIDGVDPFADLVQPPSMSCRLYRDDDGQAGGAPSASQLRQVIERALATGANTGNPAWLEALGRAGRGRVAPAEGGLRAVHQAVPRSFVEAGTAPAIPDLTPHAAPFDASQVLRELADGDFSCLNDAGQITAAYPFSAMPTQHRVRIAGRPAVFAMCAVDALGVSAMTGLPVLIESADPSTREPITVRVQDASSTWDPPTTVVYVGRTSDNCAGPSAAVCCGYINFLASGAAAARWAASHQEVTGGILGQDRALQVGIGIFGHLLT
jgi:hypothetical protein